MRKNDNTNTIGQRVAAMIFDEAGRPRSFNLVASCLGLAPRTLRRQLNFEGTSFREIRARVLGDTAIALLRSGDLNHEEIANRLGLSDAANFRQAFRRWTGLSTREVKGDMARHQWPKKTLPLDR